MSRLGRAITLVDHAKPVRRSDDDAAAVPNTGGATILSPVSTVFAAVLTSGLPVAEDGGDHSPP